MNNDKKTAKKVKWFARKAIIIPVAAALVLGAATASASSLGLFDSFGKFFTIKNGAPVSTAFSELDITQYDKLYEFDDFNARINGLLCDTYNVYISYDVEYKADRFFENGVLKEDDFKSSFSILGSPVSFYLDKKSSGGIPRIVSRDGNTISYVYELSSFAEIEKVNENEADIDLRIEFSYPIFEEDSDRISDVDVFATEYISTRVRAMKSICAEINRDTMIKDNKIELLSIISGASSVSVNYYGGYNSPEAFKGEPMKVTLKDGSTIEAIITSEATTKVTEPYNTYYIKAGFDYKGFIDPQTIVKMEVADWTIELENGEVTNITLPEQN